MDMNQKNLSTEPQKNWARRDFLKISTAGALGLAFSNLPALGEPAMRKDFTSLVPLDKRLSPEWIKSLFERGTPQVLRGEELKFVGMPVGGIGAGQLYLGGDGKLWHWDIFNQFIFTGAEHYAKPMIPSSPLTQKFSLKLGDKTISLDRDGFSDVSFRGEYPIGKVNYTDANVPLAVELEAFSPFIPLNTDDSSLPATVFQFTVKNNSSTAVETTLTGELENGVCLFHRKRSGVLKNQFVKTSNATILVCSADAGKISSQPVRPDIVFEDWSREHYDGWTLDGTAFGSGPVEKKKLPSYQGDVGGDTARVVNSNAAASGDSIEAKDAATGNLTSRDFVIERNFIAFWIGGGKAEGEDRLGLSLFVDGKRVNSATGKNENALSLQYFDVAAFAGKTAHLEIIDDRTNSWGNVGVGKIMFTDERGKTEPLEKLSDFGTLALALLGDANETSGDKSVVFGEKLTGSLGQNLTLAAGESKTISFVLAWHFPNLSIKNAFADCGRFYAAKFSSAQAVTEYVVENIARLEGQTKLWRDTWYDSTLPFWFLDRTFLNTSILATSTAYRLANGRFYCWEGVGDCAGTCGHVYMYAQAIARLFPDLERDLRERTDFGLAQMPDGAIHFRGEFNKIPAVDAQSGYILRALREHQMSADENFLRRVWPKVKLAMQWLIKKDTNNDGLVESNQHNTLDSDWFGKVAWLSGLYNAALVAAAQMADEMNDRDFAAQCRKIARAGQKNLVGQLFDGEYFINKVDPEHLNAINSGTGCEIDQVFGQSWAFQVGLQRVFPQKQTVSALKSLWKYNFTPDVGPYRERYKPGRWYAMPGEAGLLMCTFPRDDWDFLKSCGLGNKHPGFAGYFNECMNGFEHQVAGHMIWEGMVQEGLSVERTLHDRYGAAKRNPWNEIECGDHYGRSMASYGVYLAACGFEYHGPKMHIGFAPKISPENFKCAFTSAESWGSYAQKIESGKLTAEISLRWGGLKLQTIALENQAARSAIISLAGNQLEAKLERIGRKNVLTLGKAVALTAGQTLQIVLS
jgi:non-lysosomal glucosylceramidase